MRRLLAMVLVSAVAACGKPAADAGGDKDAAVAPAASAVAPAPPPTGVAAREVKEKSGLFEFGYGYPAAAGVIPALKARLDGELDKARKQLEANAREAAKEAKENGFAFNPYAAETRWQVVSDLPGWLSLSAQVYEYSGGAHPNHGFAALLWDKVAGRERKVEELFVSRGALSAAIREPFCAALDRERAKRRGGPVNRASGDAFDTCIDPLASTVILGSSNHRAFDRIGVLVGPYEAGPYAEGDYEVTLPVSAAVMAALRPEFRPAFVVGR